MESKTLEIDLNPQFAQLLNYYGVKTNVVDGFINTDLADIAKFRARTIYEDENPISSLLTVNCVTAKGEDIYELCRDSGLTIEEAVSQNFNNFSSTLNPLLVALGSLNPYSYENTTIEEWEIDGRIWEVYIGEPYIKSHQQMVGYTNLALNAPAEFINSMKTIICNLDLNNRLHWFRGFYYQTQREITIKEFIMDNYPIDSLNNVFDSLPIIPNVDFFSCRTFIVLKEKST